MDNKGQDTQQALRDAVEKIQSILIGIFIIAAFIGPIAGGIYALIGLIK